MNGRVMWLAVMAGAWCALAASAQPLERPADLPAPTANVLDRADWYKVNSLSEALLESTLRREGWNTELDQFWVQLYLDQYQVGWYDFDQRLNLLVNRLERHYRLRPEQLPAVRQVVQRELSVALVQQTPNLLAVAGQLQKDRLWAAPLDASAVANWAKVHGPLVQAFGPLAGRLADQLSPMLDADQRARLEADRATLEQRVTRVRELVDHWQTGQWTPQEWGLSADGTVPLDGRALDRLRERAARADRASPPPALAASQPATGAAGLGDEWQQWVEGYIRHYDLSTQVAGSARGILADVRQRWGVVQRSAESDLARVADALGSPRLSAADREALQAQRRRREKEVAERRAELVAELRRRLDRLLTASQERRGPPPAWPTPPVTGTPTP